MTKYGAIISLVVWMASSSFAAKSPINSISAQPLKLQDFEALQVSSLPKTGLQYFAQNLGLRLDSNSSVHNVFYSSNNFKKWVFVQAHLAVADKSDGEITSLPDGKSFFSVHGASSFFVLTKGLERTELFELQKHIQSHLTHKKTQTSAAPEISFKSNFLAEFLLRPQAAVAATSCVSSQDIQQQIKSSNEGDFKVLKSVWGCIEGTGAGVWNSTGGVVTAAYDILTKGTEQILCGAASFANATWSRCSDYAAAMQNTVDTTLHTLGNIKQVAGNMVEGFSDLPGDVQVKVLCELKGTIETGAAVSFVTAGAGAPAALSKMSQVLNKVSDMPAMSKSSATLKSMAAKVEQKSQAKAAELANIKAIPRDLQESLAKIETAQKDFAANSAKSTEISKKLDSQWQTIENNPSRYASENTLMNSQTRLENLLKLNRSTTTEDRALAKDLLKFAQLTDKEKALAQNILKSEGKAVTKHEPTADIIQLANSLKNKRLKMREDVQFASSEDYTKLTRDYIALEEKRVRANRAVAVSKQKIADEITHYWGLIDKKNLSQQDKDLLKSQVSAYMTTALCNAGSSMKETISNTKDSSIR